ncbi:MAG: T9SS type A sorting domain-containing protein [Chitinophagaceae bacterium]|nr:T9SS type A sorting domain-containing protein [Chitinophagaceae bacterium]
MTKFIPSFFKVGFLSILLLSYCQFSSAQTATITSNPGYSGNVGIGGSNYHASEHIYLDSEIGASNFLTMGTAINRVGFMLDATSTGTFPTAITNFEIYMMNVPSGTTTIATGVYSLVGYTQVFNGTLNLTGSGVWLNVDLTTPFVRTAGSNLQVLLIRNNGNLQQGFNFNCSIGNTTAGSSAVTSRRYNGTTQPSSGSTSLSQSAFRSAIQLSKTTATDVSPTAFTLPSSSCFSTPQSISVTITNTGTSNTIGAGAVNVNLSITGANTANLNQASGAAIPVGGTQVITFTNINLNTAGTNNIQALVTLTGDQNSSNDTLRTALSTLTTITSFPSVESAETSPLNVFPFASLVNGTRQLWTVIGPTTKYKNGDLTDSLGAYNGNVFYLFDSWSGASSVNFVSRLYSNCFSIPAGQPAGNYKMEFWMSHDNSYATALDSLYVTISTDKGVTWNRIAGYQRYGAAYTTPTWAMETVSLSAYAGQTIQIGFEGVSQYGNVIGLDQITVTANYPLPITLTNFSGVRESGNNILHWSTANETNNKGFELQRSASGEKFSSIASINSKAENGNSSSVLYYSFNDSKPLAGTNYYRLRQIDFDGKESFSNIVVLKSASITKAEITRVYPNPVEAQLNIVLNTPNSEKVQIRITDLVGKVISEKVLQTNQGDNNVQFNTSNLSRGTYLIKVYSSSNSEMSIQKFIKQ